MPALTTQQRESILPVLERLRADIRKLAGDEWRADLWSAKAASTAIGNLLKARSQKWCNHRIQSAANTRQGPLFPLYLLRISCTNTHITHPRQGRSWGVSLEAFLERAIGPNRNRASER